MCLVRTFIVALLLLSPVTIAQAQTAGSSENCRRSVAHMIPSFVGSWTMHFRAGYTLTGAGRNPIPTSNEPEVVRVDVVEDPPTLLFKAPASMGAPAGTVFKLEPFSGAAWDWTTENPTPSTPGGEILNADQLAETLGCPITSLPRLYGTYEADIPGWSQPLQLYFRMIILAEDEFRTVDSNGNPKTVSVVEGMIGIFDISSEHGGGQRVAEFKRQ